jgi:hypothetical protein
MCGTICYLPLVTIVFKTDDSAHLPNIRWILVFGATAVLRLLLALVLRKAGQVLSIGGTFGGYLIDFILPRLMWFKFEKGNGSI